MRFLYHTQRRTTVGRIPLEEWSVRRRDLYVTTHNIHNRDIHAPGGIRTHDLSRRAAADLRFRPRGHWDRSCLFNHKPVLMFSLVWTVFMRILSFFFWGGGHSQCCCRKLTTRLVTCARPHVRMERHDPHWMDLRQVLDLEILLKVVATSRFFVTL